MCFCFLTYYLAVCLGLKLIRPNVSLTMQKPAAIESINKTHLRIAAG